MKTIYTAEVNCRDCHKCVRICPVKAIGIVNGHATLVANNCIFCGRCVQECPRGAKKVIDNTISLWSGQRKCILILDDEDLKMMCQLYESKQRNPIDVINKKFAEFKRLLPS